MFNDFYKLQKKEDPKAGFEPVTFDILVVCGARTLPTELGGQL